jgi:hypothetical protein
MAEFLMRQYDGMPVWLMLICFVPVALGFAAIEVQYRS